MLFAVSSTNTTVWFARKLYCVSNASDASGLLTSLLGTWEAWIMFSELNGWSHWVAKNDRLWLLWPHELLVVGVCVCVCVQCLPASCPLTPEYRLKSLWEVNCYMSLENQERCARQSSKMSLKPQSPPCVYGQTYCLLWRAYVKKLNDAWCTESCPCSRIVAKATAEALSGWILCAKIRGKRVLPSCSTSQRPCCRRTSSSRLSLASPLIREV